MGLPPRLLSESFIFRNAQDEDDRRIIELRAKSESLIQTIKGVFLDVRDFGAKGDGVTDDINSFQAACREIERLGGGTLFLPHAGPWLISRSFEIVNNLNLVAKIPNTIISAPRPCYSDVTGLPSVIHASGKKGFKISNIMVVGDRKKTGYSQSDTVSGVNIGIQIYGCQKFTLESVNSSQTLIGTNIVECQEAIIAKCRAERASAYGHSVSGASTTATYTSCGAYACGGGFSAIGAYGVTRNGCFTEEISSGYQPGGDFVDPFGDSGGSCYAPMWQLQNVGSCVTDNGHEAEHNCAGLLYAEGARQVINTPYLYDTKAFLSDWALIRVAGVGQSSVEIHSPRGFEDIRYGKSNSGSQIVPSGTPVISIENPSIQKIYVSGGWKPADYPVMARGIYDGSSTKLIDLTQSSLHIGGTLPFLKAEIGDVSEIIYSAGRKRIRLKAISSSTGKFTIPLGVEKGLFFLNVLITGNNTNLAIAEYNNDGEFVQNLLIMNPSVNSVLSRSISAKVQYFGDNLHFDVISLSSADEATLISLELEYIPGQF